MSAAVATSPTIAAPPAKIVKAIVKPPPRRTELTAPPSNSDAAVSARHKIMMLIKQRPDLWPMLNVLSLGENVDWPYVFEQLQAYATLANVA